MSNKITYDFIRGILNTVFRNAVFLENGISYTLPLRKGIVSLKSIVFSIDNNIISHKLLK